MSSPRIGRGKGKMLTINTMDVAGEWARPPSRSPTRAKAQSPARSPSRASSPLNPTRRQTSGSRSTSPVLSRRQTSGSSFARGSRRTKMSSDTDFSPQTKPLKLPKIYRMEDYLTMLMVAPSRGDSDEILEAKAAVLENETLHRAQENVMRVACRLVIKAFRKLVRVSAERRERAKEDEKVRMAIIDNKMVKPPWSTIKIAENKKHAAPISRSRFGSLAKHVRTKVKLDRAFETQASRQRQRPSAIVQAAREGDVAFLREILRFRKHEARPGELHNSEEFLGLRHKIGSTLRRQLATAHESVQTDFDPTKALEESQKRTDDIMKENLDFEDSSGQTPLIAALSEKRWDCVQVLLDEGADVGSAIKRNALLPIHIFLSKAGIQSHLGILRRLLQSKPVDNATQDSLINCVTGEEVSPLMIAAGNTDLGKVREVSSSFEFENESLDDLLEASAGMMLASGPTRRKTVKKDDVRSGGLDDKEAGAGAGGSKNVVEGNGELAEAENGANFQAMKKRERSDEFVLEYLVGACGADATQQDMHGNTALDYAARRGVLSHVEFLCSLPSITSAHKEHALFISVSANGTGSANLNVLKYLMIYAGAKGMGEDFSGREHGLKHSHGTHPLPGETILHVAARHGRHRCLERFLDWMPKEAIYVENSQGKTALHAALNDLHGPSKLDTSFCVNRCAQILVRRLIGLAGLNYAPAAPVSVAEITRIIKAQDEIPSTDDQKTPSLAPSTDNARKNNHTASPSPHEKHGCRRRDGNDAQKCPEAPDIGSGAEFSRSPIGAANPYRLLEKKPLLPTVDLDKTLLYDENQQDLLAGAFPSSLIACASNDRNVDMLLQLVTLMPRYKDAVFTEYIHGTKQGATRETNLLCWAVRHRQLELVARLLQLGVNINAPEPDVSGLTALMVCVQWLSQGRWASLGMESMSRGKDEFYIKVSDLQLITRKKKSALLAIAENLKDMLGNTLRSPTGRILYKRSPWRCSWYGLISICTAAEPDLGAQLISFDAEMEDFKNMLHVFREHQDVIFDLEVNGQTASSIAASGSNWNVVDDLMGHGALPNQPALVEALALHNHLDRLKDSLQVESKMGARRLLSKERLHDIFTKTCAAGHPDCAYVINTYVTAAGLKVQDDDSTLMHAVVAQQHWMIDLHVKTNKNLGEDLLGQAVLKCAENGDYRTLEKLLHAKANPNYGYSSSKGSFTSPLVVAGKRWASSGSEDHQEVIIKLIQNGADLRHRDEEGHTIIIWAALRGHNTLLRVALATAEMFLASSEVHKVLNQQDVRGYSPLMHAVMSHQDDCVIKLLQLGADADLLCSSIEGQGPPMTALALLTSSCSKDAPSFLISLLERTQKLTVCDQRGDTFLVWACRWGHAHAVKRALELCEADALHMHAHEEGKRSALELAIIGRHREIVHMIISTWSPKFSYPDAMREGTYVGLNILHEAIQNDWEDTAQLFVEVANPFDSQAEVVREALFACIEKRWIGCLKALLDRDVDPSAHREDGSIPIITAVKMQDDDTLDLLLRKGAKDLEIAVAQAIYLGYKSGFEVLWKRVAHTADLVRTAACIASITNQIAILKVVLKAEKPEMILHRYGSKVRTICHNWCSKKIFQRLVPRLDWTLEVDDPSVPLLCAVSKGHFSCTSYLLQHDADPLIQDDKGLTPLLWACASGNLELVKLLLKRGASVSLPQGQEELSFADIKNAYHRQRMNEAIRFLSFHNPLLQQTEDAHNIQLSLSPLLVALLKGHPDVVRLLLEAGASRRRLSDWCTTALDSDPHACTIVKRIMDIAMEYEDLKVYGPFGFGDQPLNFSDAKFVPQEGRLSSIIVQFADCEWSLEGIQFVHQVNGVDVYCRRHHTSQPKAGEWETTNANMHVERMDLAPTEYIIQAEVAIGETHIVSLRFTTNRRVTKWLGGTTDATQFPKDTARVVTVVPIGREIVGLFSGASAKWNQIGFITRLRMGDYSWRPKAKPPGNALRGANEGTAVFEPSPQAVAKDVQHTGIVPANKAVVSRLPSNPRPGQHDYNEHIHFIDMI